MTNKERVLFLLQYLRDNTDEEKAVTHGDIRAMFAAAGEKVSTPTIRDDVASLRSAGYDIGVREVNGIATYYQFLDRDWTVPELQILIDAVASGQFISRKRSRELIDHLKSLAGPSARDGLEPAIRVSKQVKAPNEQILYIIQEIKEAMARDSRIRFRHYEYTDSMKRVPKHGGYWYEVSPYALIWKKDKYYLIGWSEKHGRVAHFRVDRMGMPKITGEKRVPRPKDFNVEDRSDKIFSMFDGPEETVAIRFSPELLNQVADQFGTDLKMEKVPGGELETRVKVHLSPTFYGWLFQYVGSMRVLEPQSVREAYGRRLKEALDGVRGEDD